MKIHLNGYKEGTTTITKSVPAISSSDTWDSRIVTVPETSWANVTLYSSLKVPFSCCIKNSTQNSKAQIYSVFTGADASYRNVQIYRHYTGALAVEETVTLLISYAGY